MTRVEQHIKSLIKNCGPISVADFMNCALFHPQLGYYRAAKPIGKSGDFITAPEISQVFGELIAAYFLNFILSSKKTIAFVEMGAGRGTLMYDIISTMEKLVNKLSAHEDFKSRVTFSIIEISESLTKIQQEKLGSQVTWFKTFNEFQKQNSTREIYFIANELFDCFAIHQFIKTPQGWSERMIDLNTDKMVFVAQNFNEAKHKMIAELAPFEAKIGDLFEYSFSAANFMEELSQTLKTQGGIALLIDYGYEKSQLKSTLQALKNHQYSDIFQDVGESDLTALVDFSALKKIAEKTQLKTSLVTQRDFLISLGILERAKILKDDSAINRLIDKGQMGELFKCLILWNN